MQGKFEGRSSLRTWSVGILSHKLTDYFRAAARHRREEGDDGELLDATSAEDLERAAIAKQSVAALDRALAELPERERLALLMIDVEGLDRDEARAALGVSEAHLRVLMHRGRNRLRRMLEHGE